MFSSAPLYAAAGILVILAGLFAVAAVVLAYIFIIPEKKRDSLPSFFKAVADLLNFKTLFVEKILQALYIFLSVFAFFLGFLLLFVGMPFFSCLLIMVVYPIIIRLVFEMTMLTIVLVKNVVSINKKLKDQNEQ